MSTKKKTAVVLDDIERDVDVLDVLNDRSIINKKQPWMKTRACCKEKTKKKYCSMSFIRTTIIGSLTFSLYHCAFCLAVASTISCPSKYNADDSQSMCSILGTMTKMGALGPMLIA